MKQYVRIRNEKNVIILESIHKSQDHTDPNNWDVINMLSAKQLSALSKEKIEEQIERMEQKKELWIKQGNCEEYPF